MARYNLNFGPGEDPLYPYNPNRYPRSYPGGASFASPRPDYTVRGPARIPTVDPNEPNATPNLDYWSQPTIGAMPLSTMVDLFGSMASAIAPYSVGGRMGQAFSGMAQPYEQSNLQRESLLDLGRRQAQAQQAAEIQKQQHLNEIFSRLSTPQGAYTPGEPTSGTPGYEGPGPLGTPPVGYNVEGTGQGALPKLSPWDYARLSELLGKGAAPVLNYFSSTGQAPAQTKPLAPGYTIPPVNRDVNKPFTAPLTTPQAAPPATPLGSSRPAYTDPRTNITYPAIEGQWSNRQTVVPLNPGQVGFIPGEEAQYQAPLLPSQAAPPATASGATRPAYEAGNVSYPAVEAQYKPFSPRERAVSFPAGSTYSLAPDEPLRVAAPTYRQSTINLAPGASAVTGGQITATAPTTAKQDAATSGGKPTAYDKNVQTFVQQFQALQPTNKWSLFGGTKTATPQQQAEDMILRQRNPNLRVQMEKAKQQVFGSGNPQQGSTTANSLRGQRTNRPDGTYQGPGGTVIVKGGIIQ